MEKVVRIGKVIDQDAIRREDIRNISPNKRVLMVLKMQGEYFQWDKKNVIERVVSIKRLSKRA